MAGFFKSFNREGKGVAKDAPNKKRFFIFFEILWRHAFQIIGINFIYFVITLPLFLFMFMYIFQAMGIEVDVIASNSLFKVSAVFFNFNSYVKWGLIALSAILYGPATCGLTYVMRNFAREEHTWAFSDFFERSWKNFGQGLIVGIIDILFILNASMYLALDTQNLAPGEGYLAVFKYIAIIVAVLYFVMRNYIYLMIVTFKIKFMVIIKNSALFVILNFGRNLLNLVFMLLVLFLSTGFTVFCMAVFSFAIARFIEIFNALPAVNRYMLEPLKRKEAKAAAEPIFHDDVTAREEEK